MPSNDWSTLFLPPCMLLFKLGTLLLIDFTVIWFNPPSLQVVCSDTAGLTSTANLAVSVSAVNEFSPVISAPVTSVDINATTSITEALLSVTATDADYGDDGVFSYSILGLGDGKNIFLMTSAGELKLIEVNITFVRCTCSLKYY